MSLSFTTRVCFVKPLSLGLLITALSLSSLAQADTVYGPVQSSDTLSKIIKRLYTGSKSAQFAVMKQIVADNPAAFLNGDMNHLKLNASLSLRGDSWRGLPLTRLANAPEAVVNTNTTTTSPNTIDRSAPELSVEQMKGRIVFLDAERSSLIDQVAKLKQDTVRLEKKVQRLEADSQQSDEQLRLLDAEIIRLTARLSDNKSKNQTGDARVSNADLNQLVVLQEKLRLVQKETANLKQALATTQEKLKNNGTSSQQTNQTIAKLTQENKKLHGLLQDAQPGVNYYVDTSETQQVALLPGKLQLPSGFLIVGGALLSLMLITLFATRRKREGELTIVTDSTEMDPFADNHGFNTLLETQDHEARGFAQLHTQPEENVFKMFDEGSLEMDLKLDMAEGYLQVSDVTSAQFILNEVIDGGSELQKRKATRLIDRIAA